MGATLRLPMVWLSVLLFLLYTGVESTAGQWTYTWFTESRAASAYLAGTMTSVFWAMLTVGRVVFGAGAARIGVERLLRLGGAQRGAGDGAQGGGLAGAVAPEQGHNLTGADVEGDIVDRPELAGPQGGTRLRIVATISATSKITRATGSYRIAEPP